MRPSQTSSRAIGSGKMPGSPSTMFRRTGPVSSVGTTSVGAVTVLCAVAPGPAAPRVRQAVEAGGGRMVEPDEAEVLIWTDPYDAATLGALLAGLPTVRWVQLPFAGVDRFGGLLDGSRLWTSTKGAYADPVAEHALALALAGLRQLPRRARARSWGEPAGIRLAGARVTILGGGGITCSLLDLMSPFHVEATVVRRHVAPVPGAVEVVGPDELHRSLRGAQLVVLALALTPETRGMVGAAELAEMEPDAWLVNVARGAHVVTADLVGALRNGVIGGAALDVTDPEPLPPDHPLWDLDNCLVTPHTANTWDMAEPLFAGRIRENLERYTAGRPLVGIVDPSLGY